MDLSQIIAMARECGCYAVGDDGQVYICEKCAKAANDDQPSTNAGGDL